MRLRLCFQSGSLLIVSHFLGGGAVLFSIQPSKAIVNDLNGDLVAVYETIRDDLESLLEDLKKHETLQSIFMHCEIWIGIRKHTKR